MGLVFGAVDADQRVALKLIRAEYASDPVFRERFRREVAVLSRVRAACVAEFIAADTEAARPWLATTFVSGPTLQAYVNSVESLYGTTLLALAMGIAEALKGIHAAGVIHRDLKPSNVILSPEGPRVLDFGIARAFDQTALTMTRGFIGSPGWASPEQYRGTDVGPGADVYGWGMVVAFAATGRSPFGTGSLEVMAHRVHSEQPDLDGVPDQLLPLVVAALAKDPADRPSLPMLLQELTRVAGANRTSAQVIEQHWSSVAQRLPAATSWQIPRRNPRTLVALLTAGALVTSLGALAAATLERGGAGRPPSAPYASPDRDAINGSTGAPLSNTIAASELPSRPPVFSPPSSWTRTAMPGLVFYAAQDWTNGLPGVTVSDFVCLLPPGEQPAGMAACRGNAVSFSVGHPMTLRTDGDWRTEIGYSTGILGQDPTAKQVSGAFVKVGTAFVGERRAQFREFMLDAFDGTKAEIRVWWEPKAQLWVFASLDTRYDAVVDRMLSTVKYGAG